MIAQGVLVPDLLKGLAAVTSLYTREPYYKDDGKRHLRIGGDDESFWLYNAKDAALPLEILPQQVCELGALCNIGTYLAQSALVDPLIFMHERGIRIDTAGLARASMEAAVEITKLKSDLNEVVGHEINPDSPKQMAQYFYIEKGHSAYTDRKTGKVTTDKEALARLSRKGDKAAAIMLKLRRVSKMRSTYYEIKCGKDGRLRCAFNPVGTVGGRLSSGKTIDDEGGNMQNQPPLMKAMMLADDGYVVYNIDLEQAENRCVAYFGPDYNMISAFESGADIHSLTASYITRQFGLNLTPDEIKVQDKKFSVDEDPEYASPIGGFQFSWRFWGKKANHAFNYGLGADGFSRKYEIPMSDAKKIRDQYLLLYPGVTKYWQWVKDTLSRDGRKLMNPFGRVRIFLDRWGDAMFREAYNFLPQSTVADIINRRGLLPLYNDQERYEHVELLNQVHDSIVFQVPLSVDLEKHAMYLINLNASLTQPIQWRGMSFSIPAEFKLGFNLRDMAKISMSSSVLEVANNIEEAIEKVDNGKTAS